MKGSRSEAENVPPASVMARGFAFQRSLRVAERKPPESSAVTPEQMWNREAKVERNLEKVS
jgi:hypothetical protein